MLLIEVWYDTHAYLWKTDQKRGKPQVRRRIAYVCMRFCFFRSPQPWTRHSPLRCLRRKRQLRLCVHSLSLGAAVCTCGGDMYRNPIALRRLTRARVCACLDIIKKYLNYAIKHFFPFTKSSNKKSNIKPMQQND